MVMKLQTLEGASVPESTRLELLCDEITNTSTVEGVTQYYVGVGPERRSSP